MKRNRKAKILATLGPASSDKKIIEDLFVAGCDVFRLNFSHGNLETHRKNYETIRSLEEKHNHASCILADLQGPKLRVGKFKNKKENLVKGQNFVLDLSTAPGDNNRVNFPHEEIYDFLTPNSILLINDGRIRLQVIEQKKDSFCKNLINSLNQYFAHLFCFLNDESIFQQHQQVNLYQSFWSYYVNKLYKSFFVLYIYNN